MKNGIKRIQKDKRIFIFMLPKKFYLQNKKNREKILDTLKLYTIIYDYELTKYYSEYVKEYYKQSGLVVEPMGIMQLTGYEQEEVIFNFHQLIRYNYIDTKKLKSVDIERVVTNSFVNKSIPQPI